MSDPRPLSGTRVLACCGGMVVVFGAERMTFEVLRILKSRGAAVHCIVNSWENHRILELVDRLGASHSIGRYRERLTRRPSPMTLLRMSWDVLLTSLGLLRDSVRFRPTHVFVPDHAAVLRNALSLPLLRLFGVRVVFRLANCPERGAFYEKLWRFAVAPQVDLLVPNSRFSYRRVVATGVSESKLRLIRNAVVARDAGEGTDDSETGLMEFGRSDEPLVVTIGQIGEHKGTHDAVDAVLALRRRGVPVRLAVIGRAPIWPEELVAYFDALRSRVADAGEEESIRFIGEVENVLPLMRRASLLLAPIRQEETFGNVILEARSVGLPVICSDRGGLPELVQHRRTGIVCEAGDVAALETAVEELVTNHELRERMARASLSASADDVEVARDSFERSWASVFESEALPAAREPESPFGACAER